MDSDFEARMGDFHGKYNCEIFSNYILLNQPPKNQIKFHPLMNA